MWELLILAWLGLRWFIPFPLVELAELESLHQDKPAATRLVVGNQPVSVAIADVNHDSNLDLIVANGRSNDVTVFLGDGRGAFRPAAGSPFSAGNSPNDIAVADFNSDGHLDLAFANHEAKYVTILLGNGKGQFAPAPGSPVTVTSEPHTHSIAAADFNGDRKIDLVVDNWQNSRLTFLYGKGDGTFESPASASIEVAPIPYYDIRVKDLNRDGKADIITPAMRRGLVTVLLGDGKGGFRQPDGAPFATGESPFWVESDDLNGDGKPDLAVAKYSGSLRNRELDGVSVLFGDGKGGFRLAEGSPFKAGHGTVRVALGDINGDSISDVAVCNLGSDDVTVLWGGKKGITLGIASIPVGRLPAAIAVADLNKDGKADIVTANSGSNDVTIIWSR